MKIKALMPALMLLSILTACGSNKINSPVKPKPEPAPPTGQRTCPAGTFQNEHSVSVSFAKGFPEKIAIKLDGETAPRLDECNPALSQSGVIASISRGLHSTLILKINHNGFFFTNGSATLPKTQGFEMIDMHLCNGAQGTSFYKSKAIPLDWKVAYPNGTACVNYALGEGTDSVADVEAVMRDQLDAR